MVFCGTFCERVSLMDGEKIEDGAVEGGREDEVDVDWMWRGGVVGRDTVMVGLGVEEGGGTEEGAEKWTDRGTEGGPIEAMRGERDVLGEFELLGEFEGELVLLGLRGEV